MQIAEWKAFASIDCGPSDEVPGIAGDMVKLGLRPKDAAHIACAVYAAADYFLTTDKKILNKQITGVKILNPADFIRSYLNA
jgi:predicted nucleic acid-binding protein